MKTLLCQFDQHGEYQRTSVTHYSYLYVGDKDVKIGDWAVVHSNNRFAVATIKGIRMGIDKKVTKSVLAVLTQAEFEAYQEQNKNIGEYRAKFDELEYLLKEEQRMEAYRKLASTNPRVQEILRQIDLFSGTNQIDNSSSTVQANDTGETDETGETRMVIPEGVYWDGVIFRDSNTAPISASFHAKWFLFRHLFPQSRDEVLKA